MSAARFRRLAALLPVVGLAALVARGELAQRAGPRFRLPIAGYDPRDLISGHYLNYRYDLDWQGESSCGPLSAGRPVLFDPNCCVCLTQGSVPPASPSARQLDCAEVQSCDGWLRSAQLVPPLRYWVPEDRALDLQAAMGRRRASVEVTSSARGTVAVGELYFDELPWREALTGP